MIEPALRDMIDAGFLPGPRLRASALEKGMEGVLGVPAGHEPNHDRDIPALRAYVKAMKAQGCDTIKFLMSSDEGFAPGGAQVLMYSEEEAQAIGVPSGNQPEKYLVPAITLVFLFIFTLFNAQSAKYAFVRSSKIFNARPSPHYFSLSPRAPPL